MSEKGTTLNLQQHKLKALRFKPAPYQTIRVQTNQTTEFGIVHKRRNIYSSFKLLACKQKYEQKPHHHVVAARTVGGVGVY